MLAEVTGFGGPGSSSLRNHSGNGMQLPNVIDEALGQYHSVL